MDLWLYNAQLENDPALKSRQVTKAAIKAERETNTHYDKAYKYLLICAFCFIGLWILFPLVESFISAAGFAEVSLANSLDAREFFQPFGTTVILWFAWSLYLFYQYNRSGLLVSLIFLTASITLVTAFLYGYDLSIYQQTSLLIRGILFATLGTIAWLHPLFRDFRKRTKEIRLESKPSFKRQKVSEWTRMKESDE
jgi:hypothetical protein